MEKEMSEEEKEELNLMVEQAKREVRQNNYMVIVMICIIISAIITFKLCYF